MDNDETRTVAIFEYDVESTRLVSEFPCVMLVTLVNGEQWLIEYEGKKTFVRPA